MTQTTRNSPAVTLWLWCIAALIFCMVIVGGATRLTDSGLSITEWKPILGAIPPLTDAAWQEVFAKYQQIPEYQIQNKGMSLDDFKFIFWWEWSHRFLGRFIGFAFAVPLAFFIFTRRVSSSLWPRLVLFFVLGGLQGALGWYMVSSGLVDRVDVSQYRLAAHLSLAIALYAAIVWTALGFRASGAEKALRGRKMALVFIAMIFLQVAAGGFVAGLDAGHAAYDWPTMQGQWIPDGMSSIEPHWRNMFENALAVQFNHRIIAYAILLLAAVQAWRIKSSSAVAVLVAVTAQIMLGISTVQWHVALPVALVHQGGALIVLALALWHLRSVSSSPVQCLR